MAKFAARPRRALRDHTRRLRTAIAARLPESVKSWLRRPFYYTELILTDHGFFRVFYLNKHRLGTQAWRSAQPAPYQLRKAAREGVRSILNLRGERDCGGYWLEKEACEQLRLNLVNYKLRSRSAPTKDEVLGARDVLLRVERPVLIHCKSGADRAGLMSVLYAHVIEGQPIAEAKKQLDLKFGHIRMSDTGVLDHFFESYLEHDKREPVPFFEWVENAYDPARVQQSFKAKSFANLLVNGILRRE